MFGKLKVPLRFSCINLPVGYLATGSFQALTDLEYIPWLKNTNLTQKIFVETSKVNFLGHKHYFHHSNRDIEINIFYITPLSRNFYGRPIIIKNIVFFLTSVIFLMCLFSFRAASYLPQKGTTIVNKKDVKKVEYDVVSTRVIRDLPEPEPMLM